MQMEAPSLGRIAVANLPQYFPYSYAASNMAMIFFGRDIGLDVVDLVENVTTAGSENGQPFLDVPANCLRRGMI